MLRGIERSETSEPLDILRTSMATFFTRLGGGKENFSVSASVLLFWKGNTWLSPDPSENLSEGVKLNEDLRELPFVKLHPLDDCLRACDDPNTSSSSSIASSSGSMIFLSAAKSPFAVASQRALFRRLARRKPPDSRSRYDRTASKVLRAYPISPLSTSSMKMKLWM
jgi:hypothetical protein